MHNVGTAIYSGNNALSVCLPVDFIYRAGVARLLTSFLLMCVATTGGTASMARKVMVLNTVINMVFCVGAATWR